MRAHLSGLLVFLLLACSGPANPHIELENAYIVAPIGGRTVSLGGLDITAIGLDAQLIGVTSPSAERIEIHTTTQAPNGQMRMRQLDEVALAPNTTLTLGPGQTHLMVFGLDSDLTVGNSIDLTLTYRQSDGSDGTVTTTATITEFGQEPARKR